MRLVYVNGSLFDAPLTSILVYACNTQGVWGSGIARVFKEKFPVSYKEYNSYCKNQPGKIAGRSLITSEGIGCLMTSEGYGNNVNPEAEILVNSLMALEDLLDSGETEFASNRFNAGLFAVPWQRTEKILKLVLADHPNITWTVCIPEEDVYAEHMARQG